MLKSLNVKKDCFLFAILMSLLIAFGFGHKQIFAELQDGQVNMELWTYSVDDVSEEDKKIITITDYNKTDTDVSDLKNILVPNANDFLADETF